MKRLSIHIKRTADALEKALESLNKCKELILAKTEDKAEAPKAKVKAKVKVITKSNKKVVKKAVVKKRGPGRPRKQ